MNHLLLISYPAQSAIAASLHGLAEAIQYAVDNGVSAQVNPGGQAPGLGAAPLPGEVPRIHVTTPTEKEPSPGVIPPTPESSPPGISLTEIRVLLAGQCQSGKEDAVRALLARFGADKLSQVDPRHYPALLQAAEELTKTKEENPC